MLSLVPLSPGNERPSCELVCRKPQLSVFRLFETKQNLTTRFFQRFKFYRFFFTLQFIKLVEHSLGPSPSKINHILENFESKNGCGRWDHSDRLKILSGNGW